MNSLVYLCFGKGPHTYQLLHAVLSAQDGASFSEDDSQIVVYTDDPPAVSGLDVRVEPLSAERLADWIGPFNYIYRSKVMVLRHALETYGGRVILCDSDTYFLGPAHALFDRISPGVALMHVEDGSPRHLNISELSRVLQEHHFSMRDGRRWNISPDTLISNSGVVGLHERDFPLVDETLHLLDQMCPRTDYFASEQFAFSACLSLHTRLRYAADLVHHYWNPVYREPFDASLSRVFEDPSFDSYEARYHYLKRIRERVLNHPETLRRRAYAVLWEAANKAGVLKLLRNSSVVATGIGLS